MIAVYQLALVSVAERERPDGLDVDEQASIGTFGCSRATLEGDVEADETCAAGHG